MDGAALTIKFAAAVRYEAANPESGAIVNSSTHGNLERWSFAQNSRDRKRTVWREPGVLIPKAQTISSNDLVPRMPAAIVLGDDGESR